MYSHCNIGATYSFPPLPYCLSWINSYLSRADGCEPGPLSQARLARVPVISLSCSGEMKAEGPVSPAIAEHWWSAATVGLWLKAWLIPSAVWLSFHPPKVWPSCACLRTCGSLKRVEGGCSDAEVDISATGPRRLLVLMLLLLGILIQCSVTVKRCSDFINS